MTHILSDFAAAIGRCGLTPPTQIQADGKIHRFRSGPERAENGFYRLTIVPAHQGGDIGFGLIGCWKRDVSEKWCSREQKALTAPDRKAIRESEQASRDADAKAASEAAGKAAWIWKNSAAPEDHPYLAAKRIRPCGLRLYKGSLVAPVYREGRIASLQFIGEDGTKRFLSGGLVEGGYASISGGSPARETIVIAEGYATAASLHMATGLPVLAAYNAGNLTPVAKAIRAKYPDAKIIVASDNDQWTVVRGRPTNVGVERAREAAMAVDAQVAIPVFPADDPDRLSDWNDFALRHGLEVTRDAFFAAATGKVPPAFPGGAPEVPPENGRAPPRDTGERGARASGESGFVARVSGRGGGGAGSPDPAANPGEAAAPGAAAAPAPAAAQGDSDWKARLIPGKKVMEGCPFPFESKSKTNAYLFLKHHPLFAGLLCYNEFADQLMLVRRPPWETSPDFEPRSIRDDDFFMLAAHLEYCDIHVSKDTVADAAVRVAKENAINPPREFLSRIRWDRKPRLNNWLSYYLGAEGQPSDYLALVGAKWLIGAVSRVFDPGCKFDSVLILEGAQGLGKSLALRALATFGGQDFFLDHMGDIRSKDTLMSMQGKLIVEIAELASFKKSENEEIKAFISRQVDEYRPPYGRTMLRRPRYFVLAGSINPEDDDGYLTDSTGNRRYWPVKCGKIDLEALERDAPQLWAEAIVRYRAKERTWLSSEELRYSVAEQESRFVEDAWQDRIAEMVRHEWTIRLDDVMTKLDLKPKDINNLVRKRVKNSLKKIGWTETRRPGEGRVWRPAGRD